MDKAYRSRFDTTYIKAVANAISKFSYGVVDRGLAGLYVNYASAATLCRQLDTVRQAVIDGDIVFVADCNNHMEFEIYRQLLDNLEKYNLCAVTSAAEQGKFAKKFARIVAVKKGVKFAESCVVGIRQFCARETTSELIADYSANVDEDHMIEPSFCQRNKTFTCYGD